MKTVLDLSNKEAYDYFMSPDNYCNIPLPPYFKFEKLLKYVAKTIGKKDFANCQKKEVPAGKTKAVSIYPSAYSDTNYKTLFNKDGKYAYRPMQLINPYLYYFLVRYITEKNNWQLIVNRFKYFKDTHIAVESLPLAVNGKTKKDILLNWWETIEQRSIQLSLQYKYMFITDITNCYGTIYTHTIAWAIHGEKYSKEHRDEKNVGNTLDRYMSAMNYDQTNGIPQGSTLADFIAEMVLGYADKLLADKLKEHHIGSYRILRYRDDYRVFSNNRQDLETIALCLNEVLAHLNFHLNSSKTKITDMIVTDSIKSDKLYYIFNGIIEKNSEGIYQTFQQELLFIHQFSKKYPNSGTVIKLLDKLFVRFSKSSKKELQYDNMMVLAAILTDIIIDNPKSYGVGIGLLSLFVDKIKNKKDRVSILKRIKTKMIKLPNSGELCIWLQRITLAMSEVSGYDEPLCKLVDNDAGVKIWNIEWLDPKFIVGYSEQDIIDRNVIKDLKPSISRKEVSAFAEKIHSL